MPVRISYKQKNFRDLFQQIIQKKRVQFKSVDLEVKKIIANVIKNGDDSLVRFAKQYDHFKLSKKNIKFWKIYREKNSFFMGVHFFCPYPVCDATIILCKS